MHGSYDKYHTTLKNSLYFCADFDHFYNNGSIVFDRRGDDIVGAVFFMDVFALREKRTVRGYLYAFGQDVVR